MEKYYISIVLRSKKKVLALKGGLPDVYFTDMLSEAEFERHIKLVPRVMTSRQCGP